MFMFVRLLSLLLFVSCSVASWTASAAPPDRAPRVHRVEQGETLYSVAKRYKVPGGHKALARLNKIKDAAQITVGQGILIPNYAYGAKKLPRYQKPRPAPGPWKACATQTWPAPRQQRYANCEDGLCSCDPNDPQRCICYCQAPVRAYTWFEQDNIRAYWQAEIHYAPKDAIFEVRTVELDGLGTPEVVIANRNNISNGLGVETWNLAVLHQNYAAPLLMNTSSHGPNSYVQASQGKRCDILDVQRNGLNHPIKGLQSYLTARRQRMRRGDFIPSDSWRVKAQGWDDQGDLGDVVFKGKDVFLDPIDPLTGPEFPPERVGVIIGVSIEPHDIMTATLRFKVRIRRNEIIDIPYQDTYLKDQDASPYISYQYLGLGQTPYPDAYIPAHLGQEWIGRRIWLEARKDHTLHLWIQGRNAAQKPNNINHIKWIYSE